MAAAGRLRPTDGAAIVGLSALVLATCLGGSSRLSYHEAIWAQTAREMIAGGDVLAPSLDGRPWLEKPPLGTWPIALAGRVSGGVDEAVARLPSALAALALTFGVARLAARRFGGRVGLFAGLIQASTAWLVTRGRLAEVDVTLAAIVTWAMVAFDAIRSEEADGDRPVRRWPFFALLGLSALAKGVGFGGALILATVAAVLLWDGDRRTARRLLWPPGLILAATIGLAWPLMILRRYPAALGLCTSHVADRLGAAPGPFAGEPWWGYGLAYFWQTLPWTPLAIVAARASWRRARRERGGPDRLLWAWAVLPAALVSLASVRNAHYLIYALPPWSILSALGLVRLGERLGVRGWSPSRLRGATVGLFAAVGLSYAMTYTLLLPRFDRRGAEWAFYERAGRLVEKDEPLTLVYDWPDQDRFPYPTPFGPMPHDLAVRLFYLDRPATWCLRAEAIAAGSARRPFAVIGRERDEAALRRFGTVEVVARGPKTRSDRAYLLYRVAPTIDVWTRKSRPPTSPVHPPLVMVKE